MVKQLKPQYSVAWIDKMSEIPQQKWDALAQPLTTPFLEWEWLLFECYNHFVLNLFDPKLSTMHELDSLFILQQRSRVLLEFYNFSL